MSMAISLAKGRSDMHVGSQSIVVTHKTLKTVAASLQRMEKERKGTAHSEREGREEGIEQSPVHLYWGHGVVPANNSLVLQTCLIKSVFQKLA